MRATAIAAAIIIAIAPVYAKASDVPDIDFKAYCSTKWAESPDTIEDCVILEAYAYGQLAPLWPKLSEKDKAYCEKGALRYDALVACAQIKIKQAN